MASSKQRPQIASRGQLVALGAVLVCAFSPLSLDAQTVVNSRDALGPYDWWGQIQGRHDTGHAVPIQWSWFFDDLVEVDDQSPMDIAGLPEGELQLVRVEALHEPLDVDGLLRPTGMHLRPDGPILIADYDANAVVAYDRHTGDVTTEFAGNGLDGPWDIACTEFDEQDYLCAVTSRNNNKVLVFNADSGDLVTTRDTAGGPTGVSFVNSSFGPQGAQVSWARADDGRFSQISLSQSFFGGYDFCSYCGSNDRVGLSGPLGVHVDEAQLGRSPDTELLVADTNNDRVVSWRIDPNATLGGSGGFFGQNSSILWPVLGPEDGMQRPVDIQYVDVDRLSTGSSFYDQEEGFVLNEAGSIYRIQGPYYEEFSTLFSDEPGLAGATALEFDETTTEGFVLTADTGAGTGELHRIPSTVELTVRAVGAPDDAFFGLGLQDKTGGSLNKWVWADASDDHRVTITVGSNDLLAVYAGREHGAQTSQPYQLLFSEALTPTLARPETTATATASQLTLQVTHGATAEAIELYVYSGCPTDLNYWNESRSLVAGGVFTPGPLNPPSGRHELRYPDLADCFDAVHEVPADPSGVTVVDLAEFNAVPGVEYCFATVASKRSDNALSQPSVLDFETSCAVAPAVGSTGLFCTEARPARASTAANLRSLPAGAPGQPTWYRHVVTGDEGADVLVVARFGGSSARHSGVQYGNVYGSAPATAVSQLAVYRDECPDEEGQLADLSTEDTLRLIARGGDELFFRVSHFGGAPPVWHLLELDPSPSADQPAPAGVTASGELGGVAQDGQITVCWEPVRSAAGDPEGPDFVQYEIRRGPVGGPWDTVLVDGWSGDCYVDRTLGPDEEYEYQVVALFPLYGGTPPLGSDDGGAVLRSEPSAVLGRSSAVDVGASPLPLAPPTGFDFTTFQRGWLSLERVLFRIPLSVLPINNPMGVQLWWDRAVAPTRHRVTQHHADGSTSDYVTYGQTHAIDIRTGDLGVLCYDLTAERTEDDGSTTQSPVVGWSESGDPSFCLNMCETATLTAINPTSWFGSVSVGRNQAHVPQETFKFEFASNINNVIEYQDYAGPLYLANFSGVPARVCVWQGSESCDDLVSLGCSDPDAFGTTRHDFYADSGDGTVFFQWEAAEDLFPRQISDASEFGQDRFGFEYAIGTSPPFSSLSSPNVTGLPPEVGVLLTSQCASGITVDYIVQDWVPDIDSFVAVIADGTVAATASELTGRVQVPVNPLISQHQIEVALFQDRFTKVMSRFAYRTTVSGVGDLNFDCAINVLDVVIANNHILGLQPIEDHLQPIADLNNDLQIDVLDLVSLVSNILARLAED